MVAFIVEGRAEQKIIQRICPGAKVMILECNGDHVQVSAIAKKIASLVRTCGNRHHPIVIQLDREERSESAEQFASCIVEGLVEHAIDTNQLRIGVSDRDLESWILYATDEHGKYARDCQHSNADQHEGSSGAHVLTKRLAVAGRGYHKTTVGVDMFCRISANALASKSASFRRFFEQLDLDCYWLRT